jgi:hypothetical protein
MLTYYEYAALSKTPCALADGLMLGFKQPVSAAGSWVLEARAKKNQAGS